jgi:hypothetical protein
MALMVKAVLDDAGKVSIPCKMLDSSEKGCRLIINKPLDVGTVFKIHITGASPLRAAVRWVQGRVHGIEIIK